MTTPQLKALHAQVTKEDQDRARLRAAELGLSIADYLRKLVNADIENKWLQKDESQLGG